MPIRKKSSLGAACCFQKLFVPVGLDLLPAISQTIIFFSFIVTGLVRVVKIIGAIPELENIFPDAIYLLHYQWINIALSNGRM